MVRACEQILLSDNLEIYLSLCANLISLCDEFVLDLEDTEDDADEDDMLESDDDGSSEGSS